MWVLVLMVLLFVVTPSFAEPNFSEQYERATISSIRPADLISCRGNREGCLTERLCHDLHPDDSLCLRPTDRSVLAYPRASPRSGPAACELRHSLRGSGTGAARSPRRDIGGPEKKPCFVTGAPPARSALHRPPLALANLSWAEFLRLRSAS